MVDGGKEGLNACQTRSNAATEHVTGRPDSLLARLGTRFGACEVARTLAWLSIQFYPAQRTRAEVLEKLREFEVAVAEVRQEFEREA
jgi:hypothetical protein